MIILAAGEAHRMYPITRMMPKAMLPVAGKPIAEHLLTEAVAAGIREFVFIVGRQGGRIRDHFGCGERLGVSIEYCYQEDAAGTAAALELARQTVTGSFLTAYGDGLIASADIAHLMGLDGNQLGIKEVGCPEQFGAVELDGERIVRIHEKSSSPPSNLVSTGLYLFTPEIFEATNAIRLSVRGEYELPAAITILIERGVRVGACRLDTWRELTYPWDLLSANEELMAGMTSLNEGVIEEGVSINGMVRVGVGSQLRAGTYISGPVIIGRDCELGPNCYIRASTVIGDECRIGAGVEIKNSLIMNGTKISHLSYAGDSIIGENCNLGAGTKVANVRLDGDEITVRGIDTGRRKLGVVMGDGVQTGINTCINPGTVIGGGAWIGPGALTGGEIAPGGRVWRTC